jgi:aldehyde dehydrogenase (NAD+)
MQTMCNRIMWGKTINSGQTCVAPDYLLVHESQIDELLKGLKVASDEMLGKDPQGGGVLSRNVTKMHTERLVAMSKEAEEGGGKVIMGGYKGADVEDKYFPPTVILDPPENSKIMTEEIFGCILPILTFKTNGEAIKYIQAKRGTPLAFYCFTNSRSEYETYLDAIPSGGTVRNDVLLHFATSSLPFGGLGTSGYGCGHGVHGFNAFTHARAVLDKPCHPAFEFGGIRYPPYNKYGGISGPAFKALLKVLPDIPAMGISGLKKGLPFIILGVAAVIGIAAQNEGGVDQLLQGKVDIKTVMQPVLKGLGSGIVSVGEWVKNL